MFRKFNRLKAILAINGQGNKDILRFLSGFGRQPDRDGFHPLNRLLDLNGHAAPPVALFIQGIAVVPRAAGSQQNQHRNYNHQDGKPRV